MTELLDVVRDTWNIDQWFPTLTDSALRPINCPACGAWDGDFAIRSWKYHRHPLSSHAPRCDIMFKCHRCSMTWCHGVPVPEEWYPRPGPASAWQFGTIHHSEVKKFRKLLNEKQNDDGLEG